MTRRLKSKGYNNLVLRGFLTDMGKPLRTEKAEEAVQDSRRRVRNLVYKMSACCAETGKRTSSSS